MKDYRIVHNKEKRSFETEVEGVLCHLDYELDGKNIIFTHTYVPVPLEGRGIASALVHHALRFAREKQLKPTPKCSFLKAISQKYKTQ